MELGKAYIQVIPSTKGIKGELTNELTGASEVAGAKSGGVFGTGFGKKAMTALKASGIATAGMVMAKGWSRMTAIDEAKAKLTALGHSVQEVQAISENANAAVKGTAYGMDAAMTAAASATAAGIAPGKELTRYLSLMGDAAAVAGVDMNEMGSIFNKVAANGKVTTEEMNQLADRGIPIWQLLAKETGMSMDELRSAIQSGEIDINDFQNAIEAGMGGAAKTIGSTTISGAISNIGASLSRMGANFLGSADDANSFAGKLLPLFNNLMQFMGKLETGASVLGSVLGSILGPIMDGLGNLFTMIGSNMGTLAPIKDFIIQIGQYLGNLVSAVFPLVSTGISAIFSLIKALMPVITALMSKIMPIANVVVSVVSVIVKVVSKAVTTVVGAVTTIMSKLNFSGLIAKVTGIWNGVKTAIMTPIQAARDKVKGIIDKIKNFFPLKVGKIFSGLKVPKINVSGGKAPFGIGGLGKAPHISVTWAAQGGIVNGATLIGAGEAGAEAIVPLDSFWKKMDKIADSMRTPEDITINVYATPSMDVNELASAVERRLTNQINRRRLAWQ